MNIPMYIVDAFTDRPFAGNPAAVCLLPQPARAEWMQRVAAEMNLSETAFLVPHEGRYRLRWFTPKTEVDLCGHATLASAHVLWERGERRPDEAIAFFTNSGVLTAVNNDGWIRLDFPNEAPVPVESPPTELISALPVEPLYVGRNRFDYLVEMGPEQVVRELQPDVHLLQKVAARGIIVTSRSAAEGVDFVSRAFFPALGVPEDPVTGSAHCCLGPYWADKLGKTTLVGYQASARGGMVRVTVAGERVELEGKAVTVLKGEFTAQAAF
ncbi:phenazine biosynthesis protein PhzF family [Geobacillus thermocatenulatus]|uniref:Phenazine biosynthesis protein PhzF family n=1 Tax=Geobacillus thermocatenulatus TaxID=33938 RepID=A0A226Q4T8_9BACL|nr:MULTISPECIES: PhzF family phenazine biosynthesis protein [Geobacillus]AST00591.1 phenazine biosynthesis protein PhzF family [Geobacillus thermocatenulatus]KLR75192.1 phenazine biosynthesis protein PhzF family [Geobacillus sp. T6]OXB86974.1 phenazine biosynthesis protein PhzF family [Geobacillus thermocatenulatus]RAN30269.1 phenazine biosynthesis protein PhzF family [Geobacillus sp. A8]